MAALVFCDGFDKYGPTGCRPGYGLGSNTILTGDWSIGQTSWTVVPPLSDFGYAAELNNNVMVGSLSAGITRAAGSFRFSFGAFLGSMSIKFLSASASNELCTLACSPTPNPGVKLTNGASTLLGSGGIINTFSTHVVSWDITFGAAAAFSVYLDGEALFSGTGNTANGFTSSDRFYFGPGVAGIGTADDFVLFNGADPAYDASFLTKNIVVETTFPNSEVQTQLTNIGNVLWATGVATNGVYTASTSTDNGAGMIILKVTPAVNCTLNSISGQAGETLSTLKIKGVVYSDNAGNPGSLIRDGTEVLGIVNNAVFSLPITPLAVVAGTPIWIGFYSDGSPSLWKYDDNSLLARRYANTYTSGAPAGPLAVGAQEATQVIWGNCTGAPQNFSVGLNPPLNMPASSLTGSTPGQTDLYHFQSLRSNPTAIYGLAVKGFISKSDTGPRTVSLHTKSGAIDSTGSLPGQALATSNQWQRSMYDKNPNGSVAWTKATVDAASSGVGVAT